MTPRHLRVVGQIAFGGSLTGFGLLSLTYADFVSALQPVPASMPGYQWFALLTGVLLTTAGLAITTDRGTAKSAVFVAVFLASWIVFLHIPSAFLQPELLRSPWWIRTFETLTFVGAAYILATQASAQARQDRIEWARVAIGLSLPVFGVLHLVYPQSTAGLVPPWYPFPLFWAYFTGLAQIGAGLAITVRVFPRLAAGMAGLMYGLWGLTLHIPRSWCRLAGPCAVLPDVPFGGFDGSRPGLTSLFVAFGMCGATWILAGALKPSSGTSMGGRDRHSRSYSREHSPVQPGLPLPE
jgi:uncharacterized membrane protein YphA (DoxX/SURF4 family)